MNKNIYYIYILNMLNLMSLNQRVNALSSKINNIIPTIPQDLNAVLGNGNNAGTNDIDMNGQDILDVNNIDVSTINGSPYPPVVASDTLQDVLNAGNSSDLSIILEDDLITTTKQNLISATDITLLDNVSGATSSFSSVAINQSTPTTGNIKTSSFSPTSLTQLWNKTSVPSAFKTITHTIPNPAISSAPSIFLKDTYSGDEGQMTITPRGIETFVDAIGLPRSAQYSCNGIFIWMSNNIVYNASLFGSVNLYDNSGNENKQNVNTTTITRKTDGNNATFINSNATAGFAVGVPTIEYYKSGRNTIAGDIICSQIFYAKNYAGVKTEFAKIEASVRNTSAGNDDGAFGIFATLNGVMSEFFRFNGADGENNTFYPIDLNNQAIKSSTGNINITANASTGTGNITLTPKATGHLILNNIPTSAVGLPTGAVWNNLGVLSIAP